MSIYREDLTGFDRELFIENEIINNDMNRCSVMLEMLELKKEQLYREAELKVLVESGTYDDLAFLYQEANEAVEQEKEGVLKTLWNAIVRLLNSIKEFFLGGSGKNVPDDTLIKIPSGAKEFINKMHEIIKNPLAIVTIGGVSGLLALIGADTAYQKITKKEGDGLLAKIREICNKLLSWLGEKKDGILQKIEEHTGIPIADFITKVGGPIIKFGDWITAQIKKAGGTVADTFNAFKDKLGKIKKSEQAQAADEVRIANDQSRNAKQKELDNKKAQINNDPKLSQQEKLAKIQQLNNEYKASNGATQEQLDQRNKNIAQNAQQYQQSRDKIQNRFNNVNAKYTDNAKNIVGPDGNMYRVINGQVQRAIVGADKKIMSPWVNVDPKGLQKGVRRTLGLESADAFIDINDVRDALGDNYLVSVGESGDALMLEFIGENKNDDIFADLEIVHDISTYESIFGKEITEDELLMQESDFDKEIDELSQIIDEL